MKPNRDGPQDAESESGWTAMPSGSVLTADSERVYMDGHDFAQVRMRDFLFRPRPQGREPGHNDG